MRLYRFLLSAEELTFAELHFVLVAACTFPLAVCISLEAHRKLRIFLAIRRVQTWISSRIHHFHCSYVLNLF